MNRVRGHVSNGVLHLMEMCDTLGKSDAEAEGKKVPVWAQHSFSYRFSGLPPLSCYDGLPENEGDML